MPQQLKDYNLRLRLLNIFIGIGVDDMYVIVQSWDNLPKSDKLDPLHERIARMMKHAGVSITITSATDVLAFGIGGTTV